MYLNYLVQFLLFFTIIMISCNASKKIMIFEFFFFKDKGKSMNIFKKKTPLYENISQNKI